VAEGKTLKDWFLEQVADCLNPRQQALPLGEYGVKEAPVLKVAEPSTTTTTTTYTRRST
jgi:hypothetical protein